MITSRHFLQKVIFNILKIILYLINIRSDGKKNWTFEEVISPEDYSTYVQEWIERGINLVGDCCGITTEHIKYISENNF